MALFRRMLAVSDVLVQNLIPGAMARMGLSDADLARDFSKLVAVSIVGYGQDTPSAAMRAHDMLVQAESGICAVTGLPEVLSKIGVSAADIASVSAIARPARVPLITYSGDTTLAARDVFVMGLDPYNAMQRVVGFASSKGMHRFALLAPKGASGTRASAAYAAAVQAAGGTLVSTQTYDRGNRSIVSAATRLKARGGYDAVLIADTPKYAAMAAPSLKANGAAMPKILGTDGWSGDPAIGKTASLRGAWFPAISDGRWARYAESYRGRFGLAPYRLSTFGYDSVLLVVRIARDWRSNSPFPLARFSDRDGFLGLDGPFRFGANGVGERALGVREARSGGVTIVSAAAEKFVD